MMKQLKILALALGATTVPASAASLKIGRPAPAQ
jgi:hypothetical protein